MPLVKAICPQCSGTVSVDNGKEAAICEFCGTPFIVDKAIINYNTNITNNIKIENASINIPGVDIEKKIENADLFLTKFKDYYKASKLYQSIIDDMPNDYRGWWGKAKSLTFNLKASKTVYSDDRKRIREAKSCYEKACLIAGENEIDSIKEEWNQFIDKCKDVAKNAEKRYFEKENGINKFFKKSKLLNLWILPTVAGSILGAIISNSVEGIGYPIILLSGVFLIVMAIQKLINNKALINYLNEIFPNDSDINKYKNKKDIITKLKFQKQDYERIESFVDYLIS